ncbi:MAG: serine hydrolase [Cyanobacteria bacterium J06621_8]
MNPPDKKSHRTRGTGIAAKTREQQAASKKLADSGENKEQNNLASIAGLPKPHQAAKKLSAILRLPSNQTQKPRSPLWMAIYAITITVGLSTILGTIASIAGDWQTSEPKNSPPPTKVANNSSRKTKLDHLFAIASLGKEMKTLKSSLQELGNQYPKLEPKIFLVDLDTKGFVNLQSQEIIAAASTIKLPILVAFFQDVDRGKISLEEQLVMTKELIGSGSGGMQYAKPGSKFSALKTAEEMISQSDNTATNMLIERLGGQEKLNQRFLKMGLSKTRLKNPLPDLTGTNTTSAEDLGNLLVKISRGDLVSLRSRDRMLHIMRNLARNTLLPEGLEPGAIIAHKTGDIKPVLGDVGIIDMPNGKRYIASILVKRPDNDPQAKEFIQQASRTAYQYLKNPRTDKFTLERE